MVGGNPEEEWIVPQKLDNNAKHHRIHVMKFLDAQERKKKEEIPIKITAGLLIKLTS